MNRRSFLHTSATLGALPVVATTTSRSGTAQPDDQPASKSAASGSTTTVSIQSGRRVTDQAAYDDGTLPDSAPTYEPVTRAVDSETVDTVAASRELIEALRGRLTDVDQGPQGPIGISKQYTGDGLRLFVDCPTGTNIDRVADQLTGQASQVSSWLQSTVGDRLPARLGAVDVQLRERPIATPERSCTDTVGRFADAQYRSEGVAMGAAVRSEALGSTASTGFRALRDGQAMVVTTAHTFQSVTVADSTDIRGDKLYQSRHPHEIGQCHAVGWRDEPLVDAAAAVVDTDTYPSRYLAEPGGNNYIDQPLVGAASWELLETYQAEARPIYRQGAVTGRCEGRIAELREFSNGYRELDVDIHSGGGDSGGPYYVSTEDGLLVAAIHKGLRGEGPMRQAIFVGSVLDSLGIEIY